MLRKNRHWFLLVLVILIAQFSLLFAGRSGLFSDPGLVENRSLAPLPALVMDEFRIDKFRAEADSYIADNFPSRKYLISALNFLRYKLGFSRVDRVFVGADGWLFYDSGTHMSQARGSSLKSSDVAEWVRVVGERERVLARKGIVYALLAAPVKEAIYPDLLPSWLANDGSPDAELLRTAFENSGFRAIVDVHSSIKNARKAGLSVYSKFDTHWTGEGAYLAYAALLDYFLNQGVKISAHSRTYFVEQVVSPMQRPQDLAHMLGISGFVRQTDVSLQRPKSDAAFSSVNYLGAEENWTADRIITTGVIGPTILLTGDSFSTALLPLLSSSFSKIIFTHHQNGFFREELIDRYHPDVVVLEVIESGFRFSANK